MRKQMYVFMSLDQCFPARVSWNPSVP